MSGTNVTRDYVEFPSQMMENWAREPEVIAEYAKHYETNEPIPTELLDKISKNQAPKEFFYGSISYNNFDIHKQVVDTRPKIENFSIGYVRKLLNRILNSGFSKEKAKYIFDKIPNASKVLSFTDWDSMNIAVHHNLRKDLKLICGFHGLLDITDTSPGNVTYREI